MSGKESAATVFAPLLLVHAANLLGRSSKLSWNADGIQGPSFGWLLRPRPVFIAWADIEGIDANFGSVRFSGDGGKAIGFDSNQVGFSYFAAALQRHRPDLEAPDRLKKQWRSEET